MNATVLGHWSSDPDLSDKRQTRCAGAHYEVVLWKETVHYHPDSLKKSSVSVEQELRGAGACDTCCNRTVGG